MADYTTNLKVWGSTGQEHPDNYSYLEDEAPVDAWDNFVTYNLISDVKSHLIPLTNSRIETDYGTTRPTSPEDGHLFYDSDAPTLEQYRASDSSWHALALSEDLQAHVSDTTNPHSVTFSQVGAIEDANGAVSEAHLGFSTATQSELNSHTSDTSNPHSVTFSQVGAIEDANSTVTEAHLSFSTATESELNTHESDTGNPHSVTLDQARTAGGTLTGSIDFGGNSLNGLGTAQFNSGDVRVSHAARALLVDEHDGSSWTTRLEVDETGASVTGSLSASGDFTVSGNSNFASDVTFTGSHLVDVGNLKFSDANGSGDSWVLSEDGTSGNLEILKGGSQVVDVGSTTVNVLSALQESGDRVATRPWIQDGFSMSGLLEVNSDIRLATGQSIKDGSGNNRLDISADSTEIRDESGRRAMGIFGGDQISLDSWSDTPLTIRDQEGDFNAVQYDTDSSAGVLRTPNAGARVEANGQFATGSGLEIRYGSQGYIRSYDQDNDTYINTRIDGDTVKIGAHGGLIDLRGNGNQNANLRLATDQAIEDGSGVGRVEIRSNLTGLKDQNGKFFIQGRSTGTNSQIQVHAFNGAPFQIYDEEGKFDALTYTTSSSAPGTLELTNSKLGLYTTNSDPSASPGEMWYRSDLD